MAETVADLFQPPEQSQEETPQTVSQLFTPEAAMQEARARYRSFTPGEAALATAPSPVPFTGALGGAVQSYQVRRARERIQQGQAEAGDYDSVARADVLAEKTQEAGFPGGLTHLATSAPAMLGEMAAAGGAISGAGRLAAGGAARVLPATGRLAAIGTASAGVAGRTAVVTALPSMGAYERIASGESVGSTLAHTGLNAAILGNLGAVVNRLIPGAGIGSTASRLALGGIIMPVEQQVADAVTTIAGLDKPEHQWGVLGTWTREGPEKAMHQAALQAITGLVFTGSHEIPHAFNRAVTSLRRQGYSDQAAAQVIQQAVNSPAASPRPGPVTDYAELLRRQTEAMRQSTAGRAAPERLNPIEQREPPAWETPGRATPGETAPEQTREQAAQKAQPEPSPPEAGSQPPLTVPNRTQEPPPAPTEAPGSPRTAAEPAPAPVQQEAAPKAPERPQAATADVGQARRERLHSLFDRMKAGENITHEQVAEAAGLTKTQALVHKALISDTSLTYEDLATQRGVTRQAIEDAYKKAVEKIGLDKWKMQEQDAASAKIDLIAQRVRDSDTAGLKLSPEELHVDPEAQKRRVKAKKDVVRQAQSALLKLNNQYIRESKKGPLSDERKAFYEAEGKRLADAALGKTRTSPAEPERLPPSPEPVPAQALSPAPATPASPVERHAAALGAFRERVGRPDFPFAALKEAVAGAGKDLKAKQVAELARQLGVEPHGGESKQRTLERIEGKFSEAQASWERTQGRPEEKPATKPLKDSRQRLLDNGFDESLIRDFERTADRAREQGERWSHSLESDLDSLEGKEESARQGWDIVPKEEMRSYLKEYLAQNQDTGAVPPGRTRGGGAYSGFRGPELTSLAHEQVDLRRNLEMREEIVKQARVGDETLWAQADARLRDSSYADRLLADLDKSTRPPDAVEQAVLLRHEVALRNNLEQAQVEIGHWPPETDAATKHAMWERMQETEDKLDKVERIADRVGSEAGRMFRFRRMLAKEDFTLSGLLRQARASKGAPLTEAETQRITELQKQLDAAQTALADALSGKKPATKAGGKGDLTDLRVGVRKPRERLKAEIKALRPQSVPGKVWTHTKEAMGLIRSLKTAYDESAVFRQAGPFTLGNPIKAAKLILPMFKASLPFKGEHAYERIRQTILDDPAYKRNVEAGLDYTIRDVGKSEENYTHQYVRWGEALRTGLGLNMAERGFNAYANLARMNMMNSMAASLGPHASKEQLQGIAALVNLSTGRGNIAQPVAPVVNLASHIMFAPNFLISRAQYLIGQPLWKPVARGDWAATRLIGLNYVKSLAGMAGFYTAAAWLLQDKFKLNLDMRSSDFGKIVLGHTRIDPWNGMSQLTVFSTRFLVGQHTSTTNGQTRELTRNRSFGSYAGLRAAPMQFRGHSTSDVIKDFIRSKLAPLPGNVWDVFSQTTYGERPLTRSAFLWNQLPLALNDYIEAYKDLGAPKAAAPMILGFFGMGVQVYDQQRRTADTPLTAERR